MSVKKLLPSLLLIALLGFSSCSGSTETPVSTPSTDQSEQDLGDAVTSPQGTEAQAAFETFLGYEINRQFDQMWEMLHPDCQQLWESADAFVSSQVGQSSYLKSYSIATTVILAEWTDTRLSVVYPDTAEIQYTRVLKSVYADSEQEAAASAYLAQYNDAWSVFLLPLDTTTPENKVRAAFTAFLTHQVKFQWDEMWDMIHPDFQSSYTDKNGFEDAVTNQWRLKTFAIDKVSLNSITMANKTYTSAAFLDVSSVWVDKSTGSEYYDNGTNIGVEENGEWYFFRHQVPSLTASSAGLAQYILSKISVNPKEIIAGESVTISVNVTNSGKTAGDYPVALNIISAGEIFEPIVQTISLAIGETREVTFVTSGKQQTIDAGIDIPPNYRDAAQVVTGTQYFDINGHTGSFVVHPVWIPSITVELVNTIQGEILHMTFSGSGIGDTTDRFVENMVVSARGSRTTVRLHKNIEADTPFTYDVSLGYLGSYYLDIQLLDIDGNVLLDAKQVPIER